MSRRTLLVAVCLGAAVAAAILVWSLRDAELSDEERISRLIDHAAARAEARDAGALKELVSARYSDDEGRHRRDIARLITFYFLRRGVISVYLLDRTIRVDTATRTARATVNAIITRGPRVESLQDIVPEAARSLVFRIALTEEDDGWRVTSATWKDARDLRELLAR